MKRIQFWGCTKCGWIGPENPGLLDAQMCPECAEDIVKLTHCWGATCNSNPIRMVGITDGPYGHACSLCGKTLRTHPFFGQGNEYDKGDSVKWNAWKSLDAFEKAKVYRRYGFPSPS